MNAIRSCTVDGCELPPIAKGYCNSHWRRNHLYGDPLATAPRLSTEERFWSKVDATGDCWLWTGALDVSGYGAFRGDGANTRAHRYTIETLIGPIPAGMHVDHLCRVRSCCNPAHLEVVTPAVNMARGMSPTVIAARTGVCKRGHTLADAYVVHRSDGTTSRRCRHCQSEMDKARRIDRREAA